MTAVEDFARSRLEEAFPDLVFPEWFREWDRSVPYIVYESVFAPSVLNALRRRTTEDEQFLTRSFKFLEELASLGDKLVERPNTRHCP